MRPLNNYANAETYSEKETLPVGGYIIKILDVKELNYSWGDVLNLSYDIAEGEFKDFYKNDFNSQTQEGRKWKGTFRLNVPKDDGTERDGWTMRSFKTAMMAVEDSNPNYHWNWDEQTLKGKIVGALFQKKEYDFEGKTGFFTTCHSLRSIDIIREGKYKLPPVKLLKKQDSFVPEGFIETLDDDLPF